MQGTPNCSGGQIGEIGLAGLDEDFVCHMGEPRRASEGEEHGRQGKSSD